MTLEDALASAAKGAVTGAVAGGPAGAVIGSLGGLMLDIAPEIGQWLFGDAAGKTAVQVARAVETVTGTNDADAAQSALARDPGAVSQLRVQLAAIAAQLQAEADRDAERARAARLTELQDALADRTGARSQTEALAQMHSPIAWVPAGLSGIILVAFAVLIYVVLQSHAEAGPYESLVNVLLGSLAAMATQVANYWLGSSSGSSAKNDQIRALSADAQTSVPGDLVQKLLPLALSPKPATR